MKKMATRTMIVATGVLLYSTAVAQESQLRYSGFEQRLAALEAQMASQNGLRTASYDDQATGSSTCDCNGGCNECSGLCFQPACCCCDGGAYASFEFLWLRPHASEDWVGKMSEKLELSSRTIVGYENCCGLGARARYWNFDHSITLLDPGFLGMDVNVVDLEATNHICVRSTDLIFAGGFRYAGWALSANNNNEVELDAYGLTVAADARTPLCTYCNNRWSFVYGARWSILGGDWKGDNDIIDTIFERQVRDDNLVVTELYAGFEYLYCTCSCNYFARTTVEMQNWESDVLGEPGIGNPLASGLIASTDSIGFVGVGLQLGVGF